MNVLIPLVSGVVLLFIATRTYARYISRQLGLNDNTPTPAHRLQDGRDYIPTRTHVVFAHHFSVIAGAGPIVGPTLALVYGWGPAWLWIVLGCILFGAVHDMTAMFVSMREDGRSIAEMSRRSLGSGGYLLFLAFLIMILTLINAIFLNLSCKALTAAYPASLLKLESSDHILNTFTNPQGILMGRIGGIATTSVLIITLFAPLMGWMLYRKRYPMLPMYLLAAAVCGISIVAGFILPIQFTESTWRWVMAGYVFIACWLPVWLVLQPRDFINAQILYAGVFAMFAGLVYAGLSGHGLQAAMVSAAEGERLAGGPIWPFLLITIACGAISGFHSLAATGTTVKQIVSESEVRRVGYNAMILEGVMALMALLLLGVALPSTEYQAIVFPPTRDGNPILAFAIAMGYLLNQMTGLKIAIGAVLGILVLEGFVITTLDTAVRLCRYMLEEFWLFVFRGQPVAILRNPFFNTALAVGLMLFFAFNSTIMSAWKIFGAGNQLIAALAMTVVTVWLLQRGKTFWFTLAPAVVMTITTFTTLILSLENYRAPADSENWILPGQLPMAAATLILLVLSTGILIVALRKIIALRQARRPVAPRGTKL